MDLPKEQKQITKKALLVEDNPPCQKIMEYYLCALGYHVDLSTNGNDALHKITSTAYDLIVQDLGLSDINGKVLIKGIRRSKLNSDVPLIVWSAYVHKNGEEKYLDLGADAVLIKTCLATDFKSAIEKCFFKARYKRKLYFQLKHIKEKWEFFSDEVQELKAAPYITQFKSILAETLVVIEEYYGWLESD